MSSVLKPEGSVLAGLATVGVVYSIYQLNLGTSAVSQATESNHPVLESSRKRAAYSSFMLVGALSLIARDPNIWILGAGSIVAMELTYRTAIMRNPQSGTLENPSPAGVYANAETVVPAAQQGQNAGF